ncbi:hypothetical protein D3C86_1487250 [compost metagenome]
MQLVSTLKGQRFAFDNTHQQRQQAVHDQINQAGSAKDHDIIGASVQQLAVTHDFHQCDGVGQ